MNDCCCFSVHTSQSAKFKVKYKSMHSTGTSAKEGADQGLIKVVNRFVRQCTFIPQSIITIALALAKRFDNITMAFCITWGGTPYEHLMYFLLPSYIDSTEARG